MTEPREQISYRAVRLVGVLLILQLVGLVVIGFFVLDALDWDRVMNLSDQQAQDLPKPFVNQLEQAILFVVYFLPPAILLLLAGLSFLLLRRRGWLLASIAQALVLLVCLFSYPDPRPGFTYAIIAYSVLMVLYLNSRDVRAVFHARRPPANRETETAHE
jgi:hypothetical protein